MKNFWFTLLLLFSFLSLYAQAQIANHSFISFTIPEKDLLPENVAYDNRENAFYVGSTRKGKIIKISADGKQETFLNTSQHGQWMVIGMKVDTQRRILWVCSSGGDNLVNYDKKDDVDGRPAGIFKFDLKTGKLIKKYVLDKKGEVHFFNDITLASNGDVYITHMFKQHSIYMIRHDDDKLSQIYAGDDLKYPNGLTLSPDQKSIFIAHSDGISKLDLNTKKLALLKTNSSIKTSGKESIDGLYYYKGSLIGVQSEINTIQRFYLNQAQNEVVHSELLEVNHPMMEHPTTGVLVEDEFHYIANAQFEKFSEDGSLFPLDQLYEVIVLKVKLK